MSETKKICPYMSGPKTTDTSGADFVSADCVQGDCQLWIEVYTTEFHRVQGCAIALAPQMHDGQFRV